LPAGGVKALVYVVPATVIESAHSFSEWKETTFESRWREIEADLKDDENIKTAKQNIRRALIWALSE
jgi:hypothetical protein